MRCYCHRLTHEEDSCTGVYLGWLIEWQYYGLQWMCNSTNTILMAVFCVNKGDAVLPLFSSSSCSRREPLAPSITGFYDSVSTTPGNTENLLEFLISPRNTGNLLEFNWSSWKFLAGGVTTEASSHKKMLAPVQLFGRWWWWLCVFVMMVMFTW